MDTNVIALLEKIDAHSYVMPFVLAILGIFMYILIAQISKKAKKSL